MIGKTLKLKLKWFFFNIEKFSTEKTKNFAFFPFVHNNPLCPPITVQLPLIDK